MEDRFRVRGWNIYDGKYYDDIQNMLFDSGDPMVFNEPDNMTLLDAISKDLVSELIPEQCTGLKDKNGKLIYEGDIVEAISPDEWSVFDKYNHSEALGKKAVVKDHGTFLLRNSNIEESCCLYWAINNVNVEIIGNIHENSKLLED